MLILLHAKILALIFLQLKIIAIAIKYYVFVYMLVWQMYFHSSTINNDVHVQFPPASF